MADMADTLRQSVTPAMLSTVWAAYNAAYTSKQELIFPYLGFYNVETGSGVNKYISSTLLQLQGASPGWII